MLSDYVKHHINFFYGVAPADLLSDGGICRVLRWIMLS